MASQGYRDWLAAGQPYELIRPARALATNLRAHGLTVYHYPNGAHLQADVPEDHTPFSVTGYPGTNARWRARGVDVMPRTVAENADIARQLIADRNAGVPGVMWIKYLNWTDEQGVCRQERWTPDHVTRSSTDRGHIHVSGRSDVDSDSRADGYDPIARMSEGADDMTAVQESDRSYNDLIYGVQALLNGTPVAGRLNADGSTSPAVPNVMAQKLDQLIAAFTVLANAINDAGGSLDTAVILEAMDAKLAALAAEQRDAVADLGEGGAAQVRADA